MRHLLVVMMNKFQAADEKISRCDIFAGAKAIIMAHDRFDTISCNA